MIFVSPTDGELKIDEVYAKIKSFINQAPKLNYRLIVGSDSQPGFDEVVFVTAIVIYRQGQGGRFFYHKDKSNLKTNMKKRLFYEVSRSLEVASQLTGFLAEEQGLEQKIDFEIHLDVGQRGPSNEIISEVVGMVVGSGFEALIKPDSYAASTVADKFTR